LPNQRCVRDGNTKGMTKERRDGKPVGQATNHSCFCGSTNVAHPGWRATFLALPPRTPQENNRGDNQKRGNENLVVSKSTATLCLNLWGWTRNLAEVITWRRRRGTQGLLSRCPAMRHLILTRDFRVGGAVFPHGHLSPKSLLKPKTFNPI